MCNCNRDFLRIAQMLFVLFIVFLLLSSCQSTIIASLNYSKYSGCKNLKVFYANFKTIELNETRSSFSSLLHFPSLLSSLFGLVMKFSNLSHQKVKAFMVNLSQQCTINKRLYGNMQNILAAQQKT